MTWANPTWNLTGLAMASTMLIVSCAPAAAPAPTAAPAKPTAVPASSAPDKPAEKAPAAAPSKADAYAAKLDEYYQRARASGQMNIVHYGPGPEYAPMVEAFKQRYPGVTAETVNLRGTETFQRISAETVSGKHIANVVSGGATSLYSMDQQGYFATWEGPPNAADLPPTVPASNTRYALIISMFGFIMNTSLVPLDKMPQSRQDLLDPIWKGKGKLLFEDPRAGGPGTEFFTITYDDLKQDYLDKLKEQEPTFIRDRDAAPAQVARGEYNIFLPVSVTKEILDLEKAAPTKVGWLRDGGSTAVTTNIGVVNNAPGRDVAKLWVSWWVSEEGQRTLVDKVQVYGALPSAPAPAGWPAVAEVKPQQRTADQIQRNSEYGEVMDKTFFR